MSKATLLRRMNETVRNLEWIRQGAIELNMLNSKEFIEYQDALNRYSLDPDQY